MAVFDNSRQENIAQKLTFYSKFMFEVTLEESCALDYFHHCFAAGWYPPFPPKVGLNLKELQHTAKGIREYEA